MHSKNSFRYNEVFFLKKCLWWNCKILTEQRRHEIYISKTQGLYLLNRFYEWRWTEMSE